MSPVGRNVRALSSWRLWRRRILRIAGRATLLILAAGILAVLALGVLLAWYFTRTPGVEEPQMAASEVEIPVGTRFVTLYFASASADSLVSEVRQILEPPSVSENARVLIEELAEGPRNGQLRAVLPQGVRVRHVFFDEEGRAYVDFTRRLATGFEGGSTAEYLLLTALVRTLSANLPTVRAVTLTIEGRPVETLGGHFPLGERLLVAEWW
jgi:spore germination protein GerM